METGKRRRSIPSEGLLIILRPWSFTASLATKCKLKGPRNSTSIRSGLGRTPGVCGGFCRVCSAVTFFYG